MKKVIYVDTFGYKGAHEMFNASLLVMCSIVFSKVQCRAGVSSYNCISKILANSVSLEVEYKKCYVVGGDSRWRLLLRYIISAISNIIQLFMSSKESVLIYPFNNLFGLHLLNFFCKMSNRKVLVFCHGEMEGLASNVNRSGLLSQILIFLSRNFFLNKKTKIAPNLYFSVVGDILKNNLAKLISPDKVIKFISIDHPYIFKSSSFESSISKSLEIGSVGGMSQVKGLDRFIKFVESMDDCTRKRINISITGRLFGDREKLTKLGIDIPLGDTLLSRKQYDERLKRLDYMLFFYSPDSYKMTGSGAIMDALYHGKPILSLRNDYFQYIFSTFGTFGYLFDTIEQMNEKLTQIIKEPIQEQIDFESIRSKFSPEIISNRFKSELQRIGFID